MCKRWGVVLTAVAMGAALASSACSTEERQPTTASAADTADQIVFGLNHQVAVEGVLRTRLQADTAYFYQTAQVAHLRHVKVTFYSAEGQETSTLTGDAGTYELKNGDMEAKGHVVAVTPDHRRLTTTLLRYRRGDQTIVGPDAFVFDAPSRHLEGEGFTSDPDFKNVVTKRPRRGTAGSVDLGR